MSETIPKMVNNLPVPDASSQDPDLSPSQKEAIRTQREESEKNQDDLKLVIDGATLKCDLCTNPTGLLKVNFDTPSTQEKRTATVEEKSAISLLFSGNCKKSPNSASPCAGVMQLGEWSNTGSLKVQDVAPLLQKSTIKCNYGNIDVSITDSGQINEPSSIDAAAAPVPDDEPPKCDQCAKEFTIEQIKNVFGETAWNKNKIYEEHATNILTYLNAYREKYKLNTCVRKSQFIAQTLAETGGFLIGPENPNYSSVGIADFNNKTITRFYNDAKLADYYIKPVSDNKTCYNRFTQVQLDKVINVIYKDKKAVPESILSLLGKEPYKNITIDQKKLYGSISKDVILFEDKILKVVLKKHTSFGVEIFSRAYAKRMRNNDEASRDGYNFRGRGLIQMTGRESYTNFSLYRKTNSFPEDTTGYIDFTKQDTSDILKGEFDKIADYDNPMYMVQSALWEWAIDKGTRLRNAFDNDDIKLVTYFINGGYNGLETRNEYVLNARGVNAFDVFSHYQKIYNNGTAADKILVAKNLKLLNTSRLQKDSKSKKNIQLKDDRAKDLIETLKIDEKPKK